MTERYLEDFEVGQMFGGSARIRIDHERITSLRDLRINSPPL